MNKTDQEAAFDGLYRASGVTLSPEEVEELRKAYGSLVSLAQRTRVVGRSWEVRMLPFFSPRRRTRR